MNQSVTQSGRHADVLMFCPHVQVSFYRGEIPNDLPEEVVRKRKGHDNQWLATLPLKLPVGWSICFNITLHS